MAKTVAPIAEKMALIPTTLTQMNQKASFLLLLAIALVAVLTGMAAFKMGDEALKGVSSPEMNPAQKFIDKKPITAKAGETRPLVPFKPLNVKKIEKQVETYIASQQKISKPKVSNKKGTKENTKAVDSDTEKTDKLKTEAVKKAADEKKN